MNWKLLFSKKIKLPEALKKIKLDLQKKRPHSFHLGKLSLQDQALIQHIKTKTNLLNRNNVTRTKAYLDFYKQHPEIHWAFLGHMVSRNGGWNMTDLKGSLLSKLLTTNEAAVFFEFLERGNWLVFQDVFPQLLLYEECKKCGQNFFYLLPYLHVSFFMETLWNHFWVDQNPYILAVALIINEQSYLESRVLKNPRFKKEVFDKIEFKLQDLLSMNHILFPYNMNGKLELIGQTLHQFENLHERILLGKRLYYLLYRDTNHLKMLETWANLHPHTGSRKDYWPHLFNDIDEEYPNRLWKSKLKSCQLIPGSVRFYSPKLEFSWKDSKHPSAEIMDWYHSWNVIYYLMESEYSIDGEIEYDYCKTLERLELAAIAKKAISLFD